MDETPEKVGFLGAETQTGRPRKYSDRYMAFMGLAPKRIPHWEHWSNPDTETYLTGIDYYQHPRLCRLKMQELYPQLGLAIPETDDPKPRPEEQADRGKRDQTLGDRYEDVGEGF